MAAVRPPFRPRAPAPRHRPASRRYAGRSGHRPAHRLPTMTLSLPDRRSCQPAPDTRPSRDRRAHRRRRPPRRRRARHRTGRRRPPPADANPQCAVRRMGRLPRSDRDRSRCACAERRRRAPRAVQPTIRPCTHGLRKAVFVHWVARVDRPRQLAPGQSQYPARIPPVVAMRRGDLSWASPCPTTARSRVARRGRRPPAVADPVGQRAPPGRIAAGRRRRAEGAQGRPPARRRAPRAARLARRRPPARPRRRRRPARAGRRIRHAAGRAHAALNTLPPR